MNNSFSIQLKEYIENKLSTTGYHSRIYSSDRMTPSKYSDYCKIRKKMNEILLHDHNIVLHYGHIGLIEYNLATLIVNKIVDDSNSINQGGKIL